MTEKEELFDFLNASFDHIYLITLRRSKNRHPLIKETLKGLDYEIFWGVDGEKLSESELKELYDGELAKKRNPAKNELSVGEVGCALSHNYIYRDILEKGYRDALILEDDVIIDTNNLAPLPESLRERPDDWELLYLGYMYNNNYITLPIKLRIKIVYPFLNLIGLQKYCADKLRCKYPRPYSKHLDLSGHHDGTYAYAVTSTGAEKILANQTPVSMAPDNAIGMMCINESIRAFKLKKRVFYPDLRIDTTIKNRYEKTYSRNGDVLEKTT